jgi:hypothetical protein
MFTAYKDPVYPLFVGNGRIAEYWKTKEDNHWSVTVQDSYLKNRVFSSVKIDTLNNVADAVVTSNQYSNSRGFLLEIGRDM